MFAAGFSLATGVAVTPPALSLKTISSGQLIAPAYITNAADGSRRLFVCDQVGQIRIIQDEMLLPTPFLDLSSELVTLSPNYDERGLLSVAFHPDFANLGKPGYHKFYVFYSAPSPNAPGTTTNPVNCRSTISEFQVSAGNPNVADPTSERIVLSFDKPQLNHNGGQLGFGPDGYLYISVGDGGSQHDNDYGHTGGQSGNPVVSGNLGNAQDLTKLLGKILRIDPLGTSGPGGTYGIPATNPFVGAGGGVREEIYALGMRNPWRFSFDTDPVLGSRMIEADVGQDNVEEINLIVSGGNYGWRIKEGTFNHDSTAPSGPGPLIDPVAEYAHPLTNLTNYPGLTRIGLAVVGGYVYRGSAIPTLAGQYVFGDYNTSTNSTPGGVLLALDSSNWSLSRPVVVGNVPFFLMSMGQGEDGELYVATEVARGPRVNPTNSQPSGTIYKIVQAQTNTITLAPVQDNSIFSESAALSDALGNIYVGDTNNGNLRRGLLSFNVAGNLPAGAVISSAQLTLNLNFTAAAAAANMSLYKVSQSWGEGTSGPSSGAGSSATENDATWVDRFYDPTSPTAWAVAGGTHSSTVTATTSVGITAGFYAWTSSQMVTDVQAWMTTPSANFGWLLIGDETTTLTARRFDSRESAAGVQPALQLTYAFAPSLSRRETWLQQYFTPVGTFVSDTGDANGNGVSNLLEYAYSYSPVAANSSSPGFQTSVSTSGTTTTYMMTFRRDPRAVDLTYQLQTSDDLAHWTTVVQSVGGTSPTGTAFVSEADAPSEAPVKVVTAVETLSSSVKHFSRLQITRSQ